MEVLRGNRTIKKVSLCNIIVSFVYTRSDTLIYNYKVFVFDNIADNNNNNNITILTYIYLFIYIFLKILCVYL